MSWYTYLYTSNSLANLGIYSVHPLHMYVQYKMHTKEPGGSTGFLNCFFSDTLYNPYLYSDCKSLNSLHSGCTFLQQNNLDSQKLKFLYFVKTINEKYLPLL